MEENYNRLWEIWDILQILNRKFSKFYNPSENLAIDEVVQRKGDFDTIYSQETTILAPKFTNPRGYMKVYMGEDSNSCQSDKTDKGTEGCSHKLYKENFLSFPELFNDLIKN